MSKFDINRASVGALREWASLRLRPHSTLTTEECQRDEELTKQIRAECEVKLRTRAEVDAEKAQVAIAIAENIFPEKARLRWRTATPGDPFTFKCTAADRVALERLRVRWRELCAEETAEPEPGTHFATEEQAWMCLERFFSFARPDSHSDEQVEQARDAFRVIEQARGLIASTRTSLTPREDRILSEAAQATKNLEHSTDEVFADETAELRDEVATLRRLLEEERETRRTFENLSHSKCSELDRRQEAINELRSELEAERAKTRASAEDAEIARVVRSAYQVGPDGKGVFYITYAVREQLLSLCSGKAAT